MTAPRSGVFDAMLVGAAALLVHGRSITFDFTFLDDRDLIVEDRAFLSHPGGLLEIFRRSYMQVVDAQHPYFRPVVTLSYALNARWSGVRPLGYHLTNVVVHAVACVLFLALLHRLALGPLVSRIAALIVAVHPALASAVAWIPGRNDSLCAVFALSSWLCFLRYRDHPSWSRGALHLVTFALALMTKETAGVIPIVCLVNAAVVRGDPRDGRRGSRPMFALAAGWAVVIGCRLEIHGYRTGVALADVLRNLPTLAAGFGRIAVPANPSLLEVRDHLHPWTGAVAGALVAGAAYVVPGVRRSVVALGISAFAIFCLPALAVPGDLVLESRLYLPACGVLVALAEIVRAAARDRTALVAFAGVTVAALAVVTMAYEGTFRDRRAFARAAVGGAPYSALAHFCLAQVYQVDGESDRAITEYRTALELGASYGVHNNLALIRMAGAHWTEAESELREELAIDPRSARARIATSPSCCAAKTASRKPAAPRRSRPISPPATRNTPPCERRSGAPRLGAGLYQATDTCRLLPLCPSVPPGSDAGR